MNDSDAGLGRRGMNVAMAIAFGVALVGFAVGIRPVAAPEATAPEFDTHKSVSGDAPLSRPYMEVRAMREGPDRLPAGDFQALHALLPSVLAPVTSDPEDRTRSLAARARKRAFDGAPPVIPHPSDPRGAGTCLVCHGRGVQIGDRIAPVMSHEPHSQCLQCHVAEGGSIPGFDAAVVDNTFKGLAPPGPGMRAWKGAPPVIPHGTWMRGECASCHGVTGRPGLRTTHPERGECTQCHVALVAGGG
jgi:cytochrome c-type protein NapB